MERTAKEWPSKLLKGLSRLTVWIRTTSQSCATVIGPSVRAYPFVELIRSLFLSLSVSEAYPFPNPNL
ncbi:hypothetical protein CARUB_v10002397mg [Capsella rubella]|uniref:Uncharacterized protein n=1 Tax=Capsella rubella TaxID=81985 RepID=R0GYE2_9BRAS|nr:hypothetical protein CARUB_v10002397mg [Capsella rubella]